MIKMKELKERIDTLARGELLSTKEFASIIECDNQDLLSYLYQKEDEVLYQNFKNDVYIRAIIEFSNYCRCSCYYCGLRCENSDVTRFRMQPDEIITTAKNAVDVGYQTIILQSGEDLFYTKQMIGELVKAIKKQTGITVTLSVGERDFEEYKYWKECGADRFLIKQEISDEKLYNEYHPHSNFQNRLRCLRELSSLGYELGSGFMVGLPKSTPQTLANDLLLLRSLDVKMAGIGPYISHCKTPFSNQPDGKMELTLRVLALARLLLPKSYLPSTTALNVKGGLVNALHCGANVIMQKATPFAYRDLYDIYPGRESAHVELKQQLFDLKQQLIQLGKNPL